MPEPELVDFIYERIVKETDEAWALSIEGKTVWLPKGACEINVHQKTVEIPQSLAEEKELV